jgi:alpha-beta hydrolase superfamily lysophospholipase
MPDVEPVEDRPAYRREVWRFAGIAGDEIAADAWLASEPGPVIIAGHGAESSRRSQYICGAAKAWTRRGISVLAADAPLHGDRAEGGSNPSMIDVHRPAFVERAAADVRLLLEAAAARLGRDLRPGYLGFSMGVQYGVPAVASDERFAAAVFAVGGSSRVAAPGILGRDEAGLETAAAADPVHRAGEITPRPVLMVNADADQVFSRRAALALYDALRPPKEISFFPGTHAVWYSPKQWHRRMEGFFRQHLPV